MSQKYFMSFLGRSTEFSIGRITARESINLDYGADLFDIAFFPGR